MGWIVEQVVKGGGDRVIAVKDDRPKHMAAIETYFLDRLERDLKDLEYRCHESREGGHGRLDGLKRPTEKDGLRGKMMSCMLDTDFLARVLSLHQV